MLEDEQLRQLLLVNGVCDTATITRLGAEATRSNRTLYDMVVARGVVPEAQLIQMVGAVLGVGAVLLKDFQGDAMLMSLAPVDLLKREGMLPVGIQEVEGRRSLIVAMANPRSGSALQSLRKFTSLPVVPMLAGPLDLLAAIDRCERNYLGDADDDVIENAQLMEEDSQLTAGLRFTRDHELAPGGDNPAFDELMNGFSASHPSGVMSALSIIDDIPRDRHSAATPPDGHAVGPERSVPGGWQHGARSRGWRQSTDGRIRTRPDIAQRGDPWWPPRGVCERSGWKQCRRRSDDRNRDTW